MKKRAIAVILSVVLAFGTAMPAIAEEPFETQEENVQEQPEITPEDYEQFLQEPGDSSEASNSENTNLELGEPETDAQESAEQNPAIEVADEDGENEAEKDTLVDEVLEEPELSVPVPDMEIMQIDSGELGILPNGEEYDGDVPQYPLDYLREQGIYEKNSEDSDGAAGAINSTKVDLYVLDEGYQSYLTIPSGYRQSYQLSVTEGGSVSYSVYSGDSVTVSPTGLIQPAVTTWYWNGNYGSTVSTGAPGERVEVFYNLGTSRIRVTTGSNTYDVTVTVHDYAQFYAEKVMDTFLEKNITSGMSEYEKLKKIAAFPCNFDYSARYSGYVGMIVCGGGDCWASCSAILYLCKKAGIPAHLRCGVNDSGAGSGHRNVAVKIGDKVYVADAGYNSKAPRSYSIVEENTGFYYYFLDDNSIKIVQYDGFDSDITVPSQINGYQVASLGNLAFNYGERYSGVPVKSIVLPETLKELENSAFNSCESLQTITIPASVTKIGDFVFTACSSLKEINVSAGNSQYISRDGILYDKEMNDLLYYPAGKAGAYTVPSGVKTIHDYAFYYTSGIHTLILPQSLRRAGEGAFAESAIKTIYFQGDVPELGNYIFTGLDLQGFYPKGNKTWNTEGMNDYGAIKLDWHTWDSVQNFKAAAAGKNKVRLSWTKLENAEGYLIYAQKDGKYGYVSMTSGGNTLIDNKALSNDYNYYWVFPYIREEGKIVVVPGMCSKYVYAKGICPAVTNLKAQSVSGGVKLTWTKSSDAEGYLVYGKTKTGQYGYKGMTTTGTSFTDKKALKTEYNFYWVFPYFKDTSGKMIVGGTPKYVYGKAR